MKFVFPMPHLVRLKATAQPWETQVTGADQTRMARRADEMGYDMISVPEHFVIPRDHVELSGPHFFHAAAAQGYFAGATERILINSSVAILPLQHPIVTAKALATLDWLSNGRMVATFGVGWLEEEFKLLGVPFGERGRLADEYLEAILALWTQENPSYDGRYVAFRDVAFEPKPVRQPHPPIWMGGDSDAALRRTARFASGWWPFLTPVDEIAQRIEFIRAQPEFTDAPFDVMYGVGTARVGEGHTVREGPGAELGAREIVDIIGGLRDMGVTYTSVPIPAVAGIEAHLDYCQWVIEDIRPQVQ